MKKFSSFELARIKRTAQNVEAFIKQRNKYQEQIAELTKEVEELNKLIEVTDAPTVALTGYHTEDIIRKVITPTDKVDKNGKIIKKTTYEFIYPDTIVPPVDIEEPRKEEANNEDSFNNTITF